METPLVIRPTKVTRVARSGAVSFGEVGASRQAGRPSGDTVPANSPDRQMSPPLDLDSTNTTTQGDETMKEHKEVKAAMRTMVSGEARRRLNLALSELSDDDVKKAYYKSSSRRSIVVCISSLCYVGI